MSKITIVCLIFKSIKLADWVWESAWKYTPMLKTGEAEFLFVANDATDEIINHLIENNYPFIVNNNERYTEEELFKKGYGIPEYMNRVYRGYNQGILHSKSELLVLINSDNYFSPNWLESLLKYSDYNKIVCSQIIERRHEKFGVFPTAIEHNFGSNTDNFNEKLFIDFVNNNTEKGIYPQGAYMPCLLYRDVALLAGLYPEGNIAGDNKKNIIKYGDEFFYDKLKALNVSHYTVKESLIYHLKEGEKENVEKNCSFVKNEKFNEIYRSSIVTKFNSLTLNLNNSGVYVEYFKKKNAVKFKDFLFKKIKTESHTIYKILGVKFAKKIKKSN